MKRSALMGGSMLAVPRVSPLPQQPRDPWEPKSEAGIIEDINRALADAGLGRIMAAAFE